MHRFTTYKDVTLKKLLAVSYQLSAGLASSIFKDATKIKKVKFRSHVFREERLVTCGQSGGWGIGRFFIFLFGDGLGSVADG